MLTIACKIKFYCNAPLSQRTNVFFQLGTFFSNTNVAYVVCILFFSQSEVVNRWMGQQEGVHCKALGWTYSSFDGLHFYNSWLSKLV